MASADTVEIATDIVTAFISNNSLPASELPTLIKTIHDAVQGLTGAKKVTVSVAEQLVPAVSIRMSVTPEYLVCLDDGKRFKSLRRHLTLLGMTPEAYRAKWGLPATYPMVAANYAAKRSALAKSYGLGRTREADAAAEAATGLKSKAAEPVAPVVKNRKPGRPPKDDV